MTQHRFNMVWQKSVWDVDDHLQVSTTIPLLTSLGSSIKSYSPERFVTQASQQHMDQSDTTKLIKGKHNIRSARQSLSCEWSEASALAGY